MWILGYCSSTSRPPPLRRSLCSPPYWPMAAFLGPGISPADRSPGCTACGHSPCSLVGVRTDMSHKGGPRAGGTYGHTGIPALQAPKAWNYNSNKTQECHTCAGQRNGNIHYSSWKRLPRTRPQTASSNFFCVSTSECCNLAVLLAARGQRYSTSSCAVRSYRCIETRCVPCGVSIGY